MWLQQQKARGVLALVLAALATVSLGEFYSGNGDLRGWLFFAVGFGLAAVAELFRPPGLFTASYRHIPVTRELVLYCLFSAAAVVLAVLGAVPG